MMQNNALSGPSIRTVQAYALYIKTDKFKGTAQSILYIFKSHIILAAVTVCRVAVGLSVTFSLSGVPD